MHAILLLKMIVLPRQTRDKRRKNFQKESGVFLQAKALEPDRSEELRRVWHAVDKDGNGSLDMDELREVCESPAPSLLFILKFIVLPRQARYNHRETFKTKRWFCVCFAGAPHDGA
eukprot:COSAG06_NODE_1763_length_8449_cov_184.922275_10_plen_116_part_00